MQRQRPLILKRNTDSNLKCDRTLSAVRAVSGAIEFPYSSLLSVPPFLLSLFRHICYARYAGPNIMLRIQKVCRATREVGVCKPVVQAGSTDIPRCSNGGGVSQIMSAYV